ncbi:MAG: hypothetical protein AAGE38_07315 [Pseudomonadota bacterium]
MNSFVRTFACLAAVFLTSAQAPAQNWAVPAPDGPAVPAPPAYVPVDLDTPLDLEKALGTAADLFSRITEREANLDQLVLDLALDPRAAFEYVRDEIASATYAGHLRAPNAVLIAQAGNAHDKAATLAEILTRMGYDTRLMSHDGSVPVAPDKMCRPARSFDPDVLGIGGLNADVLTRISGRAITSYRALHGHLEPSASDPPAPGGVGHIWLQVRSGGDWVDLDPWLTTNQWADRPAEDGAVVAQAPDAHVVEITVLSETISDGVLREQQLLRETFRVPQASEDWISLSFGPEVEGVGGILSEALGGIQGIAAPMKAVLTVNGTPRYSQVFAAPGVPSDENGLFSEGAGVVTSGLWLGVRSIVPGQPDDIAWRPIIDLLPPAVRTAHESGAPIDPAALLQPAPGERFPAKLESLRNIVISNGGISGRLEAARMVRELLTLPENLERAGSGQPDYEALLWSSWLQARRVVIGSEELMTTRPHHDGSCIHAARPRVMIWGIEPSGPDEIAQWLDWTLDSVGVTGGDATAQAEQRLWHASLQSALETEALLRLTLSDPGIIPLDTGPMLPLTDAQRDAAGPEAATDQAQGFLTLADTTTPPGYWWRIQPQTGRADARARSYGNSRRLFPWGRYVNASKGGITDLGAARTARLEADLARHGPQGLMDELGRLEDIRQAERAKKNKGGGTETTIVIFNVSIPISVAVGTGVGIIVIGGLLVALY